MTHKENSAINIFKNQELPDLFASSELKPRIKRKVKPRTPNQFNQNLPHLPQGWTWVVLGELNLDISDGNYAEKYPKASEFRNEGVPFIRATNIGKDFLISSEDLRFISHQLHNELQRGHLLQDDILVVTRGQIGKTAIVTESFVDCNINAQLVRINVGKIFMPRFFLYALASDSSQRQFADLKTGSALQQLPIGQLRQLCVPLAPLPEQERIVAKIEELFTQLDAGTSALEKVQAGLRRYKASVLKAAVEGKLLETRELENSGGLPEGWRVARIEEIAETIGGVTKGRNFRDKKTVMLPYLRVANVQRGKLDLEEMKEIELLESEIEKYRLREGDVVLTEGGDWDKLGRSAVWGNQIELCVHQNHIFRARVKDSELLPHWLMYFTNSEVGQNYFKEAAKQTTNLASVNLTQLRNCPVYLPPLEEQRRIVAEVERRLSVAREVESVVEKALVRAGKLRQSILKNAFDGKLS